MWYQLFILSTLTLTTLGQQYPQSQPSSYNPAQFSSSQYRPSSQFSSAPQSAPQSYSPSGSQYSPSSSQYNPSPSQYNSPSSSQYSFTTPAPKIVHSPAQVHYVNIGADLAGDYKFGYDTGKGQTGQSFREETRLPDGTVRGAYGYVDPSGQQRIVRYTAGKEGFKVDSDSPSGASAPASAPASPPQQSYRPAPSYSPPPQSYSPPSYNPAPQPSYNPAPQPAYNPAPQPSYSSLPRAPASYAAPRYESVPQFSASPQFASSPQSSSLPARYSSGLSPNSLGSSVATRPEEENYGPPVINTALLNYNIGQRN